MKNPMKACSACGAEMAKNAKACPHCGAKNKKPIYKKWWFWLIVVILVVGLAGGSNGSDQEETPSAAEAEAESKPETEQISYTHYNVTELFDALKGNALKAEKTFQDQYVELEGFVSNIDSDGDYISIGAAPDDYDYLLESVQCYIKTDEQLEQIMEVNVDDSIVIRGKIKSIGEVMGYSLDIDSIN